MMMKTSIMLMSFLEQSEGDLLADNLVPASTTLVTPDVDYEEEW